MMGEREVWICQGCNRFDLDFTSARHHKFASVTSGGSNHPGIGDDGLKGHRIYSGSELKFEGRIYLK